MPESRRPYPIRLTEDARAGWDRYCTDQRVTMTALIEALGLELGAGGTLNEAIIRRAGDIDRARRSRR